MNKIAPALQHYMKEQGRLNHTSVDFGHQYAIEPVQEQKIVEAVQLSSAFLQKINIITVENLKGETIGIEATPIASTTDTSVKDRAPRDPSGLVSNSYLCEQTDFDTFFTYAKLNAWAHKPEFAQILSSAIVKSKALAWLMVGFNGTSRAATSDPVTNKLLQDVGIGWLEDVRLNGASQVFSGAAAPGKITVGAGGDYENMDALIYDAINIYVEERYKDDDQLVIVTGRGILTAKYFDIINKAKDQATENRAANEMLDKRILASHHVELPSYFPPEKAFITPLSNLSIYVQKESMRKTLKDKPERNRIESYDCQNMAWKVEDYGRCVLVENIEVI